MCGSAQRPSPQASLRRLCGLLLMGCFIHCVPEPGQQGVDQWREKAANEEIAAYMQKFEGRGQQVDASELPSTKEILTGFKLAPDLAIDLVLAEPQINQPVEINFDHQGRLWVVQYAQYPYPKGLKVTGIDHHIRMTFDKKPAPPPSGVQGADKITFFEDVDGDGIFEKATDAITGLNIATAVTWGRGKIWVLNPPYLLAYPDANDDGMPDDDPKVCLDGFGLEDTHAVANSLRWGPDGWLYGATGSTVHSSITVPGVSEQAVNFEGQSIWRYHPEREKFEVFAEGGGNTFHVEMDKEGRIYSGTNGTSRGQYYKQGAYYTKNWGKHGPHTNDFAFGFLPDMQFSGDAQRFTHAWIKYEGDALPARFNNQIIAINPLQNFLLLTHIAENGSTFQTDDQEKILSTKNRWFRPVDIKVGPDGAVYLADWSDSRLSHVNPRDDWHRNSGRVYRLRSKLVNPYERERTGNLSQYSTKQLIDLFDHPNKWYRQQAIRLMGDRKDQSVCNHLHDLVKDARSGVSLEALWAAYQGGCWTSDFVGSSLEHIDPSVRMWGIRLLADQSEIDQTDQRRLVQVAKQENHPEVLSQLAASARRVPPELGLEVFKSLAPKIQLNDPDNALLLWWTLESNLDGHYAEVASIFSEPIFWSHPVIQDVVAERMMQRTILKGSSEDLNFAMQLFDLAPSNPAGEKLAEGFVKGSMGKSLGDYPPLLRTALTKYHPQHKQHPIIQRMMEQDPEAINAGLMELSDPNTPVSKQVALIDVLASHPFKGATTALLELMEQRRTAASVIVQSLQVLQSYPESVVGSRILKAYPDHLRANPLTRHAALHTLVSRPLWLSALWHEITNTKTIHKNDLTREIVQQIHWMSPPHRREVIQEMWPVFYPDAAASDAAEIARIATLAKQAQAGNLQTGERLYAALCSSCHVLGSTGGEIGPDLTGYDRRDPEYLALHIVDPGVDVREGFTHFALQTKDHQYFMGVLKERSNKQVTLQTVAGDRRTFSMEEVARLEPQQASIMPVGLLTDLPDEQIQDLFAYLMSY